MSISHDTTNPSRRWTPASIRKAMLLPKPTGETDRLLRRPRPHPAQSSLDRIRRMLARADLLDVETKSHLGRATRWLLVPIGDAELEWLAAFDAETTDLEDEVAAGELDTADDEPAFGSTECVDQDDPYRNFGTDREEDHADDALQDDCDHELSIVRPDSLEYLPREITNMSVREWRADVVAVCTSDSVQTAWIDGHATSPVMQRPPA